MASTCGLPRNPAMEGGPSQQAGASEDETTVRGNLKHCLLSSCTTQKLRRQVWVAGYMLSMTVHPYTSWAIYRAHGLDN